METVFQSIEILSKEKGIDPQIVLDAVKDAMLIAAKKHYRTNEDYIAEMEPKTGAIHLYAVKKVVEEVTDPVHEMTLGEAKRLDPAAEIGGEARIPKNTDALGRISAQTAKQVIFQKVREAERETVYLEYSGRAGELVNCTIKRVEGPDYILDLGKTEAKLAKKEQSRLESYSVGDRVRCVIRLVDKAAKGPGVLVSRAAPELVMRLFEQEVPEIYDSTVTIKGCAREAGERTKIAVQSRDRDVDSVGACVGMKGMRVQSIIRELRGEKIDIIEFSEEITTFAEKALQPAKVSKVSIVNLEEKQIEVIVDDTQLSLAIGKKGQNVRLAAKLLGWKIDIKSEEEKRQEVEQQMQEMGGGATTPVEQIKELGDAILEKLIAAGITTIEELADMTPEQLEEIPGIGEKTLEKISVAVRHYFGQYEEGEERPEPTHGDEAAMNGAPAAEGSEESSDEKTPEEILEADADEAGEVEEVRDLSTEAIADAEETESESDAVSEADAREETIELENDAVDSLVNESQEASDEGIDKDGHERG